VKVEFLVSLTDLKRACRRLLSRQPASWRSGGEFVDFNVSAAGLEVVATGASEELSAEVVHSGYARVPYALFYRIAKGLSSYKIRRLSMSFAPGEVKIEGMTLRDNSVTLRPLAGRIADIPPDAGSLDILRATETLTPEELDESGLCLRTVKAHEDVGDSVDKAIAMLAPLGVSEASLREFLSAHVKPAYQGGSVAEAGKIRLDLEKQEPGSWSEARVLPEKSLYASVSPSGLVVNESRNHKCVQEILLRDVSNLASAMQIRACIGDTIDTFAWSADGRLLATSSRSGLRVVDRVKGRYWSSQPQSPPGSAFHLAWSHGGDRLASASLGFESEERSLRLWRRTKLGEDSSGDELLMLTLESTVGCPARILDLTWDEYDRSWGFFGYGAMSVHPETNLLAAVALIRDEPQILEDYRADDWILLFEVPGLNEKKRFEAHGQVIDLVWASANHLILCGLDCRSRVLDSSSGVMTEIGIESDMCRINPFKPIAAFCSGRGLHYARNFDSYYSELHEIGKKHSVAIADWKTGEVFSSRGGNGSVTDMNWSHDGKRLYVLTEIGTLYVYRVS
jgi:hypothetical protein